MCVKLHVHVCFQYTLVIIHMHEIMHAEGLHFSAFYYVQNFVHMHNQAAKTKGRFTKTLGRHCYLHVPTRVTTCAHVCVLFILRSNANT